MGNYDIFIQAGQSNAVGTGHGPVSEPYEPNENVLYLLGTAPLEEGWDPEAPYWVETAQERPYGENGTDKLSDFSLAFARDYIQKGYLKEGRKLLIVRTAVGGTGFMFNHWEMDAPLYTRMLRMVDHALTLGEGNRIMGMLWHQGEHEAFEGNEPERYRGQLTALLESVKQRYNCPDLPFISGGFCHEWFEQYKESCIPILQVIRDVTKQAKGIFIETDDLLSNNQKTGDDDPIHFCRESLYTLGHRYFEAYTKIRQSL